jgi:hypothetical protein
VAMLAQMAAPPAKPQAAAGTKPASPRATPAAGATNPVVFTEGSIKLTKSEFDLLMKIIPTNLRGQIGENTPETRRLLADKFGDVVLYANEAKKRKLDSKPETRLKLLFQEQSLLAGVLYQQFLESSKPTEAASRAWYDSHKADYEQAVGRHILIRFKGSRVPLKPGQEDLSEVDALAKATAFRERIIKGEDFAAVARAESDDTGSGVKGGDLGHFGRKEMLPEVEKVAFTLPIGEVSQPIKSQVGFHLFQVQERRTKDFAEARPEIDKRLQVESAQKAMKEIKNSVQPVLDEDYFGKPASAGKTEPPPSAPPAK